MKASLVNEHTPLVEDNGLNVQDPNPEIERTAFQLSEIPLSFEEICRLPLYNWYKGIVILQACHSEVQENSQFWDGFWHAAAVILTTLTGSAIFVNMSDGKLSSSICQYIAGLIAFSSTCIQALLKSKKLESKVENHKMAHKILSKMRIRLEVIMGHVNDFERHDITNSSNHPMKKLNYSDDEKGNICKRVSLWVREYVEMQDLIINICQEHFNKQRIIYDSAEHDWKKVQGMETGQSA